MALSILSSNRIETLQSRLTQHLAAEPLADPFAREVIVVPTYAMSRWLNLRIAQQQGIAANIQYPQVGEWSWELAGRILQDLPHQDPYSRDLLGWQIFAALPGLLSQDAFASLRWYLDDDNSGIKRWQLAQRIAISFDHYQVYRPELIRDWSLGNDSQWQARLWRKIVATRKQAHRVEIMGGVIDRLDNNPAEINLPERISLFAISSLAPLVIEFINALARRTEVILYQHNPTDQYWADLVSEKAKAKMRLQNPADSGYLDSGNSLLASWGRQGQVMQDLLLELGSVSGNEIEDNQAPGNDSILQCLQASLFNLEKPVPGKTIDDSISVQICHSPMRECQVLHDHLLMLLDRHPELSSEDILVMVPEISRYAPYIEAVFQQDTGNKRPGLAWNISDISVSDAHPLVRVFLKLLKLPGSRFTRSDVMAFLECSEIRNRFGIDPQMLELINQLLDSSRVHWGIDADQRRDLGLPAIHENTWQQAWDRFFAGYAMLEDSLWHGIAPITEIDTDGGIAISQFRYLFERLTYWHQKLATAASAGEWQQRLHQLIEEFFSPRRVAEDLLQPLRNAISQIGQSESVELSPALVCYWMEKQLATNQQPGRLYSGGITFCGMQPMRNIPFPVICVLGMQDSAFPRRDHPAEFDLMHQQWRPGDPLRSDEDRYLMLETLLCARRYLYFSYCGRSLKDNSECQPSVLLRELLDYVDISFASDDTGRKASEQISRVHPMQSFSARNFTPANPGYDQYWFDTSQHLAASRKPDRTRAWRQESLASSLNLDSGIDLEMLKRFFNHPIRYFFSSRLGIRIPAEADSDDEESFTLQGLQKWALAVRLADNQLNGRQNDDATFSALGLLPHGRAAQTEWLAIQSEYRVLLEQLEDFRGKQPVSRPVECRMDDLPPVHGEVNACYPDTGLMHFSASKDVKSRALMSLWLDHLALSASNQIARHECSQLLIPGTRGLRFEYLEAGMAKQNLATYVALFQQGLEYPLPVFPDTSYAYASQADPETAMSKALACWNGGQYRNAPAGECEDEFIQLALHQNTARPLEDPLFQHCARQIYLPAIQHGDKSA
ncbi:MAG: exodeoxyribonuclease V subunit gamma [Gammaproteobacteria bacterium]|nr:exodeoxyribonuclease V subunit gamma [Gammaproteobacteria bacterium]